jgi:hypothetical protein
VKLIKNIVIATVPLAALLAAGCASGLGSPAAVSSHVKALPSASHSAAAPSLGAQQQKFANDVRAWLTAHGSSNTVTDAQLASIADQACAARKVGGTQSALIAGSSSVNSRLGMSPTHFVRLAEKDVCPGQLPPPPLVLHYSGHGNWQSPDFTVSDNMTVVYSYSGNTTGYGGDNFAADIQNNGDDVSLANDIAVSGGNSTNVHPNLGYGGSKQYYLSVQADANASWSFTITINYS